MIQEIKPSFLFLISWLIWGIFALFATDIYLKMDPINPGLSIFVGYNIAFILGVLTLSATNRTVRKVYFTKDRIQKLILFTFLLGTVGVMLRLQQRLAFGYSLDVLDNRYSNLEAGEGQGGITSIISAIMFPFSFISLIISIYFRKYINTLYFVVVMLFGLWPLLDSLLMGGRSVLFFQGIALAIILQLRHVTDPTRELSFGYYKMAITDKLKFSVLRKSFVKMRRVITFVLIGIFTITVFISMNNLRSADYEKRIPWPTMMQLNRSDRLLDYPKEVREKLYNHDKPLTYFSQLMMIHYVNHGVYEYIRWTHNMSMWGTYYGKYQFYVFVKFFKMLGVDTGEDFMSMTEKTGRAGVFTTFWGPVYMDFGIFGIVYAFFLGMLFKKIYLLAVFGKQLLSLLLYPFVGALIFSSTIVNAAVGQNMYYLPAILVTYLFYKIKVKSYAT